MTKAKKFECRIEQEGDTWTAQITRRKTSRETVVSKSQSGFASESEAKAWGDEALKSFLEGLHARNKKRSS